VGEALVSTLDAKGRPTVVEWCLMAPPRSRIGPMTKAERTEIFQRSPLKGRYDEAVDRQSAYEMLEERERELARKRTAAADAEARRKEQEKAARKKKPSGSRRQSVGEAFMKSMVRTVGTSIGRSIVRGILGSIVGRR
jgi:hypothetical protein